MQQNTGLLQSAFAGTDTIKYGAFAIRKDPGASWKTAIAFAGGQVVNLSPAQKRYLALLISQQGEALTLPVLAAETPDSNTSHWYLAAHATQDHHDQYGSRKELINHAKVMVAQIKGKLEEQGIPADIIVSITHAGRYCRGGEKGALTPSMAGAYYIHAPSA